MQTSEKIGFKDYVNKFIANLAAYFSESNSMKIEYSLKWVESQNKSEIELTRILKQIIENEIFFPKVAEFKKYFVFSKSIHADEAYFIASKTSKCYGNRNVLFANNRISQTIKRGWGSWENFCCDEQENHFRHNYFIKIYEHTEILEDAVHGYLKGFYDDDQVVLIKEGGTETSIQGAIGYLTGKNQIGNQSGGKLKLIQNQISALSKEKKLDSEDE